MNKTIIFDFDGTIADTFEMILDIVKKHSKEFGLPKITQEMINDFRGKSWRELLLKYASIVWKLPFIIPKAQNILNQQITRVALFPGIKKVITNLHRNKFKLGILSTNSKENVEKFLKFNRINIFDFIYSEKNLFGKAKALKNLIKNHNLKSEEIIYVGDEVRDIDACKANNIKIIAVTWGFNKKKILQINRPDYLIDSPNEILSIVNKN